MSKKYEWPIYFFSALELSQVNVPTPSNVVLNEMGTPSVAEAAAILAGDHSGRLIQNKQIYYSNEEESGAVTIALAQVDKPFAPHKGELHLIGSGPGDLKMLTSDSRQALTRCACLLYTSPSPRDQRGSRMPSSA